MNLANILAVTSLIFLALAHSYLGERFILIRLFRRIDLPAIWGSAEFTKRTLRFAWHLTSVAWLGFAAILAQLRNDYFSSSTLAGIIAVVFLVHALVSFFSSKGRHFSWALFLVVSISSYAISGANPLQIQTPHANQAPSDKMQGLKHSQDEMRAQLRQTEIAFAKTMADRDFKSFASFIADDAIFMNEKEALRGKASILAAWKKFYSNTTPPFSWQPDFVEVLADASLGHTEGPVTDAKGNTSIRFASTWRRDAQGQWKIVFDHGYPICACLGVDKTDK